MTFNDIIDNWKAWQSSLPSPYPKQSPSILMQLVKSSGIYDPYESYEHRPEFDVKMAEITDKVINQMPLYLKTSILGRHAHSVMWRKRLAALGDSSTAYAQARTIICNAHRQ